jgi:hypothetical protein
VHIPSVHYLYVSHNYFCFCFELQLLHQTKILLKFCCLLLVLLLSFSRPSSCWLLLQSRGFATHVPLSLLFVLNIPVIFSLMQGAFKNKSTHIMSCYSSMCYLICVYTKLNLCHVSPMRYYVLLLFYVLPDMCLHKTKLASCFTYAWAC